MKEALKMNAKDIELILNAKATITQNIDRVFNILSTNYPETFMEILYHLDTDKTLQINLENGPHNVPSMIFAQWVNKWENGDRVGAIRALRSFSSCNGNVPEIGLRYAKDWWENGHYKEYV